MNFDMESILGTNVLYTDYLGLMRSGTISWVEPYNAQDAQSEDGLVVWCYITDDVIEYNQHMLVVPGKDGNSRVIDYAEMRLSSEICIDNGENK